MKNGLYMGLPQAGGGLDVLTLLRNLTNLIFFKDFVNSQSSLTADYSAGTGTGTLTSARGASNPATYVNSSGVVVTTTTANTPRYQGGYYDINGFVSLKGLMIEGASTNLIPASSSPAAASWTKTNITASDTDAGSSSPDGTSTCPSITASGTNGTIILASAVTASTMSIWMKRKTGTGNVAITANGGTTYVTYAIDSTWRRFCVTAASASQTCGIKISTSGDAVYIWGAQFENTAYPTSYIPTTAGALSRAAETLTYPISGNRSAATETFVVKFATNWNCVENTGANRLLASDTKDRAVHFNATSNSFEGYPNKTDNSAVTASQTYQNYPNRTFIYTNVVQHSSPYIRVYKDITSQGTYTAGDFTDPVWGTNFYIGSDNAGANQLNGVIQAVIFYSDAKAASVVSNICNIISYSALPSAVTTLQRFVRTSSTFSRIRLKEPARNYIIVRNVSSNDMEIGFTTNSNNNPAVPGSATATIASGEEWYETGSTNQVFIRSKVNGQTTVGEIEVSVPIS